MTFEEADPVLCLFYGCEVERGRVGVGPRRRDEDDAVRRQHAAAVVVPRSLVLPGMGADSSARIDPYRR